MVIGDALQKGSKTETRFADLGRVHGGER